MVISKEAALLSHVISNPTKCCGDIMFGIYSIFKHVVYDSIARHKAKSSCLVTYLTLNEDIELK